MCGSKGNRVFPGGAGRGGAVNSGVSAGSDCITPALVLFLEHRPGGASSASGQRLWKKIPSPGRFHRRPRSSPRGGRENSISNSINRNLLVTFLESILLLKNTHWDQWWGRGMFRKRSASPAPDSPGGRTRECSGLSLSEKSEGGIFVMQRDRRWHFV